jgi:hypothetical protein
LVSGIDTGWVVDPRKIRGCCHIVATTEAGREKMGECENRAEQVCTLDQKETEGLYKY